MVSTPLALDRVRVYPTYFETLSIPGAAHLSAWITAGLVAVGAASLGFLHWRQPALLGTFTLLGACIAIVPVTMKAVYAILLSWAHHVPSFLRPDHTPPAGWHKWYEEEFQRFGSSQLVYYFGIGYSVFAVVVFWLGGAFERLRPPDLGEIRMTRV